METILITVKQKGEKVMTKRELEKWLMESGIADDAPVNIYLSGNHGEVRAAVKVYAETDCDEQIIVEIEC